MAVGNAVEEKKIKTKYSRVRARAHILKRTRGKRDTSIEYENYPLNNNKKIKIKRYGKLPTATRGL